MKKMMLTMTAIAALLVTVACGSTKAAEKTDGAAPAAEPAPATDAPPAESAPAPAADAAPAPSSGW